MSIFQDPQQVGHSEKSLSSAGTLQNTDTVAIAKALHSNVGVIDKAAIVLAALETGPATLVELTNRSGLSRPTAHRIATALEVHHFVDRNNDGRFVLGARFAQLAVAAGNDRLIAAGIPILQSLHDRTGESAQIYRRHEGQRICIASVERTTGLRDSVPVGTRLSLAAGAASHVLLAWEPSENLRGFLSRARFGNKALADVRRRDWAESVDERETGVSSVAAPIRNASGQIVAAINLSGPSERMGEHPGHLYAPVVLSAAKHLSDDISHAGL
ncbi:IclR family transcriptional regulator [Scardovia wiggsiae]|uniref:IclR family transcriptional regulator n=1 Tax=Scardovia wiggsiae TaxID=230143 RepID=UPI0004927B17